MKIEKIIEMLGNAHEELGMFLSNNVENYFEEINEVDDARSAIGEIMQFLELITSVKPDLHEVTISLTLDEIDNLDEAIDAYSKNELVEAGGLGIASYTGDEVWLKALSTSSQKINEARIELLLNLNEVQKKCKEGAADGAK